VGPLILTLRCSRSLPLDFAVAMPDPSAQQRTNASQIRNPYAKKPSSCGGGRETTALLAQRRLSFGGGSDVDEGRERPAGSAAAASSAVPAAGVGATKVRESDQISRTNRTRKENDANSRAFSMMATTGTSSTKQAPSSTTTSGATSSAQDMDVGTDDTKVGTDDTKGLRYATATTKASRPDRSIRQSGRSTKFKQSFREEEEDDDESVDMCDRRPRKNSKPAAAAAKPVAKAQKDRRRANDSDAGKSPAKKPRALKNNKTKNGSDATLIGSVVRKKFKTEWFWGEVVRIIEPEEDDEDKSVWYGVVYDDGDEEEMGLDELRSLMKNADEKGIRNRRENATARQFASYATISKEEETVRAVHEDTFGIEDWDISTEKEPVRMDESSNAYTDLNFSFSNSLLNAFNSSSSYVGAQYLKRLLLTQSRKIPGVNLWNELLHLITYGPQGEGEPYPDRIRIDLLFEYLQLLIKKLPASTTATLVGRTKKQFSEIAEGDGTTVHTYWGACLNQISKPYYCAVGDEYRTNADALQRIGQSVHAKACCIDIFLDLLEFQIKPCLESGGIDGCHEMPILQDILHHRGGVRNAFSQVIRAYTSQWLLLGHFVDMEGIGTLEDTPGENGAEPTIHDRIETIQMQSVRLLESLGKLCSYIAWMYSLEDHENPTSIARATATQFYREVQDRAFEPPREFIDRDTSTEEYWRSIKLQFVLLFHKEIMPGLRPALAESLGVAKTFNACFGKA